MFTFLNRNWMNLCPSYSPIKWAWEEGSDFFVCECENKNVWVHFVLTRSEGLSVVLLKFKSSWTWHCVVGCFLIFRWRYCPYPTTQRHILIHLGTDIVYLFYVFFWVFPRRPIVVCRRFGTLYQFHLQGLEVKYTSYFTSSPWRWKLYRVPKRRQTTIGRRGNTQKNTYKIQNTAKVWNQELFTYCTELSLPTVEVGEMQRRTSVAGTTFRITIIWCKWSTTDVSWMYWVLRF